jgi:hypothetical protein
MLNIDRLLKKKGWTGEELGRLELANTLNMFSQSLQGIQEPVPIVSKADFRKMLDTITDPIEGRIYNGYISIHEWFSTAYTYATANEQQAHLNFNELMTTITNAITAESVYKYVSELPLIMTEKQYKQTVEQRTEEILAKDGETAFNLFNLLVEALDYYIRQLQKEPRKANPLKPLKKKLEAEKVTDPLILTKYNKVMKYGYLETPDGKRSDKLSSEEWAKALMPDNRPYNPEAEKERRILTHAHFMYTEGMSFEEADSAVYKASVERGETIEPTFHYYPEPPEDLNKWEILETGDLGEYYVSLWGEEREGLSYEESIVADAKDFIKEYPTVVKALLEDMEQYIEGVSSIPVEEWVNQLYSWRDLYRVNAYGFREMYTDDIAIFDGNRRAQLNGIAILKPNSIGCTRIDRETGFYKAPEIRNILSNISLEAYFTDAEDYAVNVEKLERARKLLLDSYYFIKGYNLAIDLIAERFKLEELEVAKLGLDSLDSRIQAFNASIEMLYKRITQTDYEDKELKAKKLEVLKDVFTPISLEGLDIPEEKIAKAKEDMKDFKAFKNEMLDLRLTLCYRDLEGV